MTDLLNVAHTTMAGREQGHEADREEAQRGVKAKVAVAAIRGEQTIAGWRCISECTRAGSTPDYTLFSRVATTGRSNCWMTR